jgi:hypothetical protein
VHQDSQSHTLQAFLNHGKTSLNVSVQPRGQGSHLDVSHQNLPTYFIAGDDGTLSDDFLTLYTEQAAQR